MSKLLEATQEALLLSIGQLAKRAAECNSSEGLKPTEMAAAATSLAAAYDLINMDNHNNNDDWDR